MARNALAAKQMPRAAPMVERAIHLSVRALVTGMAAPPAAPDAVANPGHATALRDFEVRLEAARPRVLPGEENHLRVHWRKLRPTDDEADLEVVADVPAELRAPAGGRSARLHLGGARDEGHATFTLTGEEPGGVHVDVLLTLEDDDGMVLGRAKAGFALARHRVVIADVEVAPAVVEAGGDVTVTARYHWTGASRVRGTLGGHLKRRADGQLVELRGQKVSALGERTEAWRIKAPVDQQVADFDVELAFEGKQAEHKAGFGKTGVLAVRRARDAEVVSLGSAAPRAGSGDEVAATALVRNTGVQRLEGHAHLALFARLPGAAEADFIAGVPEAPAVPVAVEAQDAARALFRFRVPPGLEGCRIEGNVTVEFPGARAERRGVLVHIVKEHVLDFDAFAAERFAYGAGEEAVVECRVRDDGSRPGGAFDLEFALRDGRKDVATAARRVELAGDRPAVVSAALQLPADLDAQGPLDLEVRAPALGSRRTVPGFLRVRRTVASRVVIVRPPAAPGTAAFLFEGEAVAREEPLGEVEGAGPVAVIEAASGGYFFAGPSGAPLEERSEALERAATRALWPLAPEGPTAARDRAWKALLDAARRAAPPAASDEPGAGRRSMAPSEVADGLRQGRSFEEAAADCAGTLREVLHLTDEALGGSRLPASEVANMWVESAEEGAAGGARGWARCASALTTLRTLEGELRECQRKRGLTRAGARALAQAAILRRAVEVELLAVALREGAPDAVLALSVTMKGHEERLRGRIRFWCRWLAKHAEVTQRAAAEAASRRQLAALREAAVDLRGADAIMPGRYNTVELRVSLPPGAPGGGMASAAVALPSELWIMGSEAARWTRGQYLLPALPLEPGGAAAWKLELYVPDRAGMEPGAIEVRLGFEAEGEGGGGEPAR